MKRCCLMLFFALLLTLPAQAADIPQELERAVPEAAEELLPRDAGSAASFSAGVQSILEGAAEQGKSILRKALRGAAKVLLVAVLCGAVECFAQGAGGKSPSFLPVAGGLAVTVLTTGSLGELIGLGSETIAQLNDFSRVLLPTLAAASAVGGAAVSASAQQVTAVFLVSILIALIDGVLVPLCYLYIGVLAAGSCLQESRLEAIAAGLKKVITWTLTTSLLLFTIYLSAARILTGGADAAAVKVTKAAISGAVPVVGSIISDAAETVLAGAGLLRSTIGIFGTLAILAACAIPFLRLGIQYLLYKGTAFLAAAVGAPWLCKLIDGLGGAFGLVLGMTGSCAVLLLVSVLSFAAAVTP